MSALTHEPFLYTVGHALYETYYSSQSIVPKEFEAFEEMEEIWENTRCPRESWTAFLDLKCLLFH